MATAEILAQTLSLCGEFIYFYYRHFEINSILDWRYIIMMPQARTFFDSRDFSFLLLAARARRYRWRGAGTLKLATRFITAAAQGQRTAYIFSFSRLSDTQH